MILRWGLAQTPSETFPQIMGLNFPKMVTVQALHKQVRLWINSTFKMTITSKKLRWKNLPCDANVRYVVVLKSVTTVKEATAKMSRDNFRLLELYFL